MSKTKGGPGSGRKPGSLPRRIGGPSRPVGVKPSAAYPLGRNPDGSPRRLNDRDTSRIIMLLRNPRQISDSETHRPISLARKPKR